MLAQRSAMVPQTQQQSHECFLWASDSICAEKDEDRLRFGVLLLILGQKYTHK